MITSVLSATRSNTRQLAFQSNGTLRLSPLASIGQWINSTLNTNVNNNTFQVPSWLGPILWAAPKKKTSHSKKRMRASNKGLQQKENIVACPACGNTKLLHHVCKQCYGEIKQKAKNLEMA
ncbi:ribosomal L32p protein family-domain-containing protein [Absidia repens]|uniref:Large ribosomal subunit protein bL32m n=1 Tax=Absidia repens TaxID=90262 RepID=A0A1X2J0K1_9FUNG|nr:ribosomal L32p protein family-domain-containing protein [Absidia repens]